MIFWHIFTHTVVLNLYILETIYFAGKMRNRCSHGLKSVRTCMEEGKNSLHNSNEFESQYLLGPPFVL